MNALETIASLDDALADAATVTLRNGGVTLANVPAFVRAQGAVQIGSGTGKQRDWRVIVSPTGLAAAPWDGVEPAGGMIVVCEGKDCVVQWVNPLRVEGVPVRFELWARG